MKSPFRGISPVIFLTLLTLSVLTLGGCSRNETFVVGFSGCLTGKFSGLGTSARNGVILAAEKFNETGGIGGKRIELIIRDDGNDPVTALAADKELVEDGARVIIGHMTSGITLTAKVQTDALEVPLISPTASTEELSDIDDYFFRVVPPNTAEIDPLVDYITEHTGIRSLAAAADASNLAYTFPWTDEFLRRFAERGGHILESLRFDSSSVRPDFPDLARQLLDPNPDAVLITADALNTAFLAQQIHKTRDGTALIPCGWAMTEELINNGGDAAEGMVFATPFYLQSENPVYTAFREDFISRFGGKPDFAAINGYEALWILVQALEEDCEADIPSCLIRSEPYRGLLGDFKLDRFGDPERDFVILRIDNGVFTKADYR